MVIYH